MSRSKTVIGVDIDNVLCDTDSVIRQVIRERFGVHSTRRQITSWYYSECLPITRDQEIEIFGLFNDYYGSTARPIRGAASALMTLSRSASIWILTVRPDESSRLTRDWLNREGMTYDQLIHAEDKLAYAGQVRLLIDDRLETALAFAARAIPVILFDRPWNANGEAHPFVHRVRSWKEALSRIPSLLQPMRAERHG